MGKLSTRTPERIPSEEIQGRILSGFAGPSLSEQLKAYELALGPKNVRASSYVESEPSVMVKRNGEWVSPDKGTDIYDLTTDVIPDLPAILGGGLGAAYGGTQGAVGGATAGNVVKQRVGEALGLRDGVNEAEAKLEGIGELVGPIGGKALAMVPMPNIGALTAYHGSPHLFNKFDMSKIGTGEGAQAWGHGLYFAENPETARSYKSVLRDTNSWNIDGVRYHGVTSRNDSTAHNWAAKALEVHEGDKKAAIKWLREENFGIFKDAADILKKAKSVSKDSGNLYTVDIPDEHIDRMLDWDKPLIEQSQHVKDVVDKLAPGLSWVREDKIGVPKYTLKSGDRVILWRDKPEEIKGSSIYQLLVPGKTPKEASETLRQLGIPGIKYLDQGSRIAGDGTRNFVLFDDSIPKILNRE